MLLNMEKCSVYFGETVVLENITATLNEGDRVGIIGENGAGKTTLLRVIIGELSPNPGLVQLARGAEIGYLRQTGNLSGGPTVWDEAYDAFRAVLDALAEMRTLEGEMAREKGPRLEELLARYEEHQLFVEAHDGYSFEHQIRKVLSGMGFPPDTWEKSVNVLSGGERTRLALAKLLLRAPTVLVLDEPTNHLDFDTLRWLESFLKGYKGAVLAVSHDRYFLDQVTTRIWEVEDNGLLAYKGNYSAYLVQKAAAVERQQRQYEADKARAAKLQDYVDRNLVRASTTKMAQSRRKALEKMDITQRPRTGHDEMRLHFTFDITPYTDLLMATDLKVAVGNRTLVDHLNFVLHRDERLVIAGPNGTGKSTLLSVLCGRRRPSGGRVRLGQGAKISFFEQQQIAAGGRVYDAISDAYPRMEPLSIRSHLALFGFRGEDVFKEVHTLSGGELAKLRMAQMVLEQGNLLFFDEPTNHLDIYAREGLAAGLAEFAGAMVVVTHDRYLMQQLACPILYLEDGGWNMYPGYNAMLDRAVPGEEKDEGPVAAPVKENSAKNLKEQRRLKVERRQKLKELENLVETLQGDLQGLENELADEQTVRDHERMGQIAEEMSDKRFALDEAYAAWAALGDEVEQDGDEQG